MKAYNVVSAYPDDHEIFCQLQTNEGSFKCTKNLMPFEYREEFDKLIEDSEEWEVPEYGGAEPGPDDIEPPACGGVGSRVVNAEERVEKLILEIPLRFPVAIRKVRTENSSSSS